MFKLSNTIPTTTTIKYSVIHNNSAVSSKWRDVFAWINKVLNSSKNNNMRILTSPRNKIIFYVL